MPLGSPLWYDRGINTEQLMSKTAGDLIRERFQSRWEEEIRRAIPAAAKLISEWKDNPDSDPRDPEAQIMLPPATPMSTVFAVAVLLAQDYDFSLDDVMMDTHGDTIMVYIPVAPKDSTN